jgi:lipoprotein NlpI
MLSILLILTGCTNFKEKEITKKNIVEIQRDINIAKKVTPEEARQFMLGATILVHKQRNIYGKKVREVIEEGKNAAAPGKP